MTTSLMQKDSESDSSSFTKKYIYTPLNEIKEPGEYNFYGIIYDATFPTQEENNSMSDENQDSSIYNCIIKLIDQSINCLTNPEDLQDNLITLIIKASDKENIPFIHNIGDIIRIHRGIYSPKKKRLVYLQILKGNQFKGAWCVFSGASDVLSREMNPYLCSHQHFTFESQDKQNISLMRNWIRNYFNKENSLNYAYESKLISRVNLGSDNDVLVQIVHKVELNDQIVFFIQDETDGCELHTYKYFNFIEIGDVCRLRSYKCIDQNDIIMNEHSNLLKIPKFTNYYIEFIKRLNIKKNSELDINKNEKDTTALDIINNANLNGNYKIIESPKNILTYIENFKNYEIKHFDEIENENNFLLDVNMGINQFLVDCQLAIDQNTNLLQQYVITYQIFEDGISKNNLFDALKRVFKSKIQCVWIIERTFGTINDTSVKPSNENSMFI